MDTVDQYIQSYPDSVQKILTQIRIVISETAPEAEECISYQIPTFKLNGNLVHFSANAGHIGFYPTPSGITHFENELAQYKYGKGTLRFPLNDPIPYELIKKIVLFRVNENKSKAEKKLKK